MSDFRAQEFEPTTCKVCLDTIAVSAPSLKCSHPHCTIDNACDHCLAPCASCDTLLCEDHRFTAGDECGLCKACAVVVLKELDEAESVTAELLEAAA